MLSNQLKTIEAKTLFDQKILGFEDDCIIKEINENGFYSKQILIFLKQILDKISKPIILDIGANIGNHSLFFSKFCQKIYAFEPSPIVYDILEKNITNNGIDNITLFNFGLSDINEKKELYFVLDGNCGASSLHADLVQNYQVEEQTVELKRGDEVIADLHIEKIDFIKIDVEGHEMSVLKGLHKSLEKYRPFILMEYAHIQKTITPQQIIDQFLDYEVFDLCDNYDIKFWQQKYLHALRRSLYKKTHSHIAKLLPISSNPNLRILDLLLVPKEKLHLLPK